jgi:adenine-specific DNA methylase
MFNHRQLLGLGILLRRIRTEQEKEVRYALLTVFSDFLRYQNMLCRYDVYALKCQDIFSVHGFPVGLIQCEASLIGIPNVGSGAFRHFINKYLRAKEYCERPFETRVTGRTKKVVPIVGERIEAKLAKAFPQVTQRAAFVKASSAEKIAIPPASLNGVFTDPPYYDNVQYAELMDFCYAWLRLGLGSEFSVFRPTTTRTHSELTGNAAMGRGLDHFTEGLSKIYCHYAGGLKPGAPFVFTYHHNDPLAYVPLVVAILDADLDCSATFPVPGEMGASLHIARSNSSVLDTVFVCRRMKARANGKAVEKQLRKDIAALRKADLKVTEGDIRCLLAGHLARIAINGLRDKWNKTLPLQERVRIAEEFLQGLRDHSGIPEMIARLQGEGLGLRNYRYAASV